MKKPVVSICIASYAANRTPHLLDALKALAGHPPMAPHEIVLSLDAPDREELGYRLGLGPTPSLQALDAGFSDRGISRWTLCSERLGIPRSWNIACHMALGEIFVIMNDDCLVGPGCLDGLVIPLLDVPGIGVTGVQGCTWQVTPSSASHQAYVQGECDAVSGFLFATTRQTFQAVGGFNDRLSPGMAEEIWYCLAAREGGWTVMGIPGLNYRHTFGASSEPDRVWPWAGGDKETWAQINARNLRELSGRFG